MLVCAGEQAAVKILVTGGAGHVGRYVWELLVAHGHEVTVCGRTPGRQLDGAAYRSLDVTEFAAVRAACEGMDRVVHLAAIPNPNSGTSEAIFKANCEGTYNVFQACADVGIGQLAVASSINALGHNMGRTKLRVSYFPIDEDHPQGGSDPYSFSKQVTEQIGRFFWEKDGIASVSIRIPWVGEPTEGLAERRRRAHADPERWGRGQGDYWTWIDARDSARAFAMAVEQPVEGAHTIFVNDDHNALGVPSRELAARFYPYVTDWREPMTGTESLVSVRRAKELLGWEPAYSWRDVPGGGGIPQG
jgi:nucleoside-diphosphate-sugar epimerase